MRITWVIFIFMIVNCYGVSVDYFLGNKELELEDIKANTIENKLETARRTNEFESAGTTDSIDESNDEEYDELSDIEYQMMKRTFVNKAPIRQSDFDMNSSLGEIGHDSNGNLRQGLDYVSQAKSFDDIIKEFGYHDDTTGSAYIILRGHNKTKSEAKSAKAQTVVDLSFISNFQTTTINQLKFETDFNTVDENELDKLSLDFYNVMPATTVSDVNDGIFDANSFKNNSIWYVPENSPCWDLPILYGEMGPSPLLDASRVFLMYPGNLKNVKETKEEQIQPTRSLYIPLSQTMNKWCAAGPCYGDHTMCLFSDKTNSKFCRDGYTVSTPTMVEQIGLVNTVNSMRNRIANGETVRYKHLPKAANMNQLIYDFDLESMAVAWLHQCLPGPAACSALDGNYVRQLECTKHAKHCCISSFKTEMASKCIPEYECNIDAIIGCIHVWFWKAGEALTTTDVECGHIEPDTFHTAQLLWAETTKIGCAYGKKRDGDVRVVCNFAPGAPFYIDTQFYCGFISHKAVTNAHKENITSPKFLDNLGINLFTMNKYNNALSEQTFSRVNFSLRFSDLDILGKIYNSQWMRGNLKNSINDTVGLIAQLVTKYTFGEDTGSKCDMNEAIYATGEPGSKCVERGRRYHALCYDFRDPTPGYRLVAVLAPVALFSLILYDLFNGVVRQTNY